MSSASTVTSSPRHAIRATRTDKDESARLLEAARRAGEVIADLKTLQK